MAQFVTTAQVAAGQQVSIRTVMRMVQAGDLPFLDKLPGQSGPYLFDPEAVKAAFAKRAERTEAAAS